MLAAARTWETKLCAEKIGIARPRCRSMAQHERIAASSPYRASRTLPASHKSFNTPHARGTWLRALREMDPENLENCSSADGQIST